MIEGQTILCFASGYEAPPTSKHHVMHLLAERNTVLWVNYHASRTPTASSFDLLRMVRKLGQVLAGLQLRRKNLYVLTPLVLPLPTLALTKRVNQALLIRQIRRALSHLQTGPLQIWSFTPDISYVLGHFGEQRVVYYCVDDFASFSGYNKQQVLRDEADLCHKADLVVTTSLALHQAKAALNPHTILVTHGVDYEHFAKVATEAFSTPADIARISHPRLGFFGLIHDWVDLDMLTEVARRRPQWQFVFLGDSTVDLAPYRALSNMHFLGRKPYEELPAYCKEFDVGLIPFKINNLTQAVNPIKLREYLAAGLPVVSAPLQEVKPYADFVQLASTADEFVMAAEASLRGDPAQRLRRMQAMATETWAGKVRTISDCLEAAGRRELSRGYRGGAARPVENEPYSGTNHGRQRP